MKRKTILKLTAFILFGMCLLSSRKAEAMMASEQTSLTTLTKKALKSNGKLTSDLSLAARAFTGNDPRGPFVRDMLALCKSRKRCFKNIQPGDAVISIADIDTDEIERLRTDTKSERLKTESCKYWKDLEHLEGANKDWDAFVKSIGGGNGGGGGLCVGRGEHRRDNSSDVRNESPKGSGSGGEYPPSYYQGASTGGAGDRAYLSGGGGGGGYGDSRAYTSGGGGGGGKSRMQEEDERRRKDKEEYRRRQEAEDAKNEFMDAIKKVRSKIGDITMAMMHNNWYPLSDRDICTLANFFGAMMGTYISWNDYISTMFDPEPDHVLLPNAISSDKAMVKLWGKHLSTIKSQVAIVKDRSLPGKFANFVKALGELPQLMQEADAACDRFVNIYGLGENRMLDHQDIISNINSIIP